VTAEWQSLTGFASAPPGFKQLRLRDAEPQAIGAFLLSVRRNGTNEALPGVFP